MGSIMSKKGRAKWSQAAESHRDAASTFNITAIEWLKLGERRAAEACYSLADSEIEEAEACERKAVPWWILLCGKDRGVYIGLGIFIVYIIGISIILLITIGPPF